jgi:hypothetical protein
MGKMVVRSHTGWLIALILSLSLPLIASHASAQGGSIELAVDTANFNQDGLLVLFGGLRMQGEIGLPVAAGDINGDGRGDVIFCGMYGSTGFRENNGVVNFYISDGRDSGFVNASENPPNIFKLTGQRSGDLLGTSASANGDVNGDGIRDVVIGAACHDGPNGGISDNRGAAYLVLGSQNFAMNADLADGIPPAGVTVIYGPQTGGRMGIWIDAGDIDGDGRADIVIGADQVNSDAGQHAGGAYILFGAASLPSVIDLAAPPAGVRTARIIGANAEDHWGAALQVGDLNNDGIGDVVIGGSIDRDSGSFVTPSIRNGHNFFAASFGGQRPLCGEAFVIYGQANWPAITDLHNPPQNATHVIGANPTDFLASQLHTGDVNGDGRTDLIIGALLALAPDNKGQTGGVFVVYGSPTLAGRTIDLANPDASGERVTTIYGEHVLDCAGDSVRTYDINKDGMSDLFIGSPERTFDVNSTEREDAGVTELIYGQSDFLPAVIKLYDPPTTPRVFRLAGAHSEDEFSYRLAGADVDGDGYIDYVSNAMHGDGFGSSLLNAGNVYIFSGKKLSARLGMLPPQQAPTPVLNSASLQLNGQTVQQASAGQSGLRLIIAGVSLRADTEIRVNGVVVISHLQSPAPGTPDMIVDLDENPAIRSSAGSLLVRARNTLPTPSVLSNEVNAGRLIGPEITRVKVKKKPSGVMILNIFGTGFTGGGTVVVTASGAPLTLQSTVIEPPDFAQVRIGAASAPAPGTSLRIRLLTAQGVQSNEVTATSK